MLASFGFNFACYIKMFNKICSRPFLCSNLLGVLSCDKQKGYGFKYIIIVIYILFFSKYQNSCVFVCFSASTHLVSKHKI